MSDQPPMIRSDNSNTFANHTMKVRVPEIVREVGTLNSDYPLSIQHGLSQLAEDLEANRPIPPIQSLSPDYEQWARDYAPYAGDTWLNTDWFFAEIYLYRFLMQVVRWWETGRDPFAPKKEAELSSSDLWEQIERALALQDNSIEERLRGLIHLDLWGNRIDLSLAESQAHGTASHDDDLLVDDSALAVRHLFAATGDIHLIADNTGTELAMDLALADALLDQELNRVTIHPKIHPTFVSDAIVADVHTLIARMNTYSGSPSIRHLGDRLYKAFEAGRLCFAPNFYWNSTRMLWEMPPHLYEVFRSATVVIVKGDANYRRMVGDRLWLPETPFSSVTDYFPAPLLALRTLKSDAVIGLPEGAAGRLNAADPLWRVTGRYGLIQFRS